MGKKNDSHNLQHTIVSTTGPTPRNYCLKCRVEIGEEEYLLTENGDKFALCSKCKPYIEEQMRLCKPLMHKLQL